MNFDFALILVILVIVTGVIWGCDVLFFSKKRKARAKTKEKNSHRGETPKKQDVGDKDPILLEFSRFLFPVVLIVLLLRGFLVEPFQIPSGSMLPTLQDGDFILVSKFTYGLRLPVLHTKVIDLELPQRGQVIVFRYPRNPSQNYIKRVVGIPGDKITYYDKLVYINGTPAAQDFVDSSSNNDRGGAQRFLEHLDGVDHNILRYPGHNPDNGSWTVPKGSYFVMGDNRDNSNDSRRWGLVPEENLVGKAFLIWMNFSSWRRIGTVIK